jgi:hypothetical protein
MARGSRFECSTLMQRLRHNAELSRILFDGGGTGTFAASMSAWSRILLGSPVVGNPHGSCDRERCCAEQIRIAILLIENAVAQSM